MAFYGRTYTTLGNCVEPGCVYVSGGLPGKCSQETGILLNNEIIDIINERKLESKLYKEATVKVVTWDDQWVSMDDKETLQLKTDFAREQCLGGVMVWAISHDTPTADLSKDLAEVSNRQVSMQFDQVDNDTWTEKTEHSQCRWSDCGASCPAGWSMVERADDWKTYKGQPMIDATFCMGVGYRSWCCPPDSPLPTCGWYGFNKGKCKAGCPDGMLEIASTGAGCRFDVPQQYQSGCCSPVDADGKELSNMALYNTCEWSQEWPNCDDGVCSGKKDTLLGESGGGTGVTQCSSQNSNQQTRKLCCDTSKKNKKFENCEWHDGSDLIHPATSDMRCWSGCPDGQIRVAMNQNDKCLYAGARALCCDGTDYMETEHLSDELQQFKEDLGDWLTNAVCVRDLSKRDINLEAREDLCEIKPTHSIVIQLVAIFYGYLDKGGRTNHYNRIVNMWNIVTNQFEHLSTKFMLPWITSNDTFPEFYQQGFEATARSILWVPEYYDEMIANSKTDIYCTQDLCDYGDGMCERDEDSLELMRREFEWNEKTNVLMLLEKRGNVKKEEFICKDKDGKERQILYTRFGYPGSSKWALTTACAQEAIDLKVENRCTDTGVVERQATADDLKPGENNKPPRINTEHLIELKLMKMFMQWALKDADCQVDCDFLADWFTQEVIENAPETPGSNQNLKRPVDRIMEQFGSNSNKDVFRLLKQSINAVKGDLWNLNLIPGIQEDWPVMVQSDNPRQALNTIRNTIAVYNYQNMPKVLKRFKMVNDGIRTELNRAAKAYKAKFGKDVNLVDCWDRFFKQRKDAMVTTGRNFVTTAINEMRTQWTNDPEASIDWNTRAQNTRDRLDELTGHVDEIYMDDLQLEKFD